MSRSNYIIVRTTRYGHTAGAELPVIINGNTLEPCDLDCSNLSLFLVSNKRVAAAKAKRLNNLYPEYRYSILAITAVLTEKVGG